jgi:hypothetical protein
MRMNPNLTQEEKDSIRARVAAKKAAKRAHYPLSKRKRQWAARTARRDALEAERSRLRMLAVLNLGGDGTK